MSVIIKNMEMPKSCKSCDLLQDYDGDMYCPLNDYLNFGDIENVPDYVMDGCRLVELPEKHRRLGDLDALRRELIAGHDLVGAKYVQMADTVIEAEGET